VDNLLNSLLHPSKESPDSEKQQLAQLFLVARCRVALAFGLTLLSLFTPNHQILLCTVGYLLAAIALQWAVPALKHRLVRLLPILVDAVTLFAYIHIRRDFEHPLENIMTFITGGTVVLLGAALLLDRRAMILAIALIAGGYVACFHNFFWSAQVTFGAPLLMAMMAATGLYIHHISVRNSHESRRNEKLCRFLSPQVVSEVDRSDLLSGMLKAHSCEVTVMFADIRGFTTLSEKWPVEQTVETLNEYFALCTRAIYRHSGTVDKFIGDCVMALFGAPITNKDDALRAVRAVLDIQQEVELWNIRRLAEGKEAIRIGIGLNTSMVMAGAMGTSQRLEYTAIGDGVNVASRLCGMTKDFNTPVVFSESTAENITGEFQSVPLGESKVRGRSQTLKVFTLQGQKKWEPEGAEV